MKRQRQLKPHLTLDFTDLPLDLVAEILLRCSPQGVRKMVFVSPVYAAMIRQPGFQRIYEKKNRSKVKTFSSLFATGKETEWVFRTWKSVLSSSPYQHLSSYTKKIEYTNGLLLCSGGQNPILFNPTNGHSRALPKFCDGNNVDVKTFLGFDSESWIFKIVGMSRDKTNGNTTTTKPYENHRVLTMDGKDTSPAWRKVSCNTLHLPETKSISIDGVLHYAAYLTRSKVAMISFHMKTETFSFNQIPETPKLNVFLWESGALNVKGKVAISFTQDTYRHRIWVLEDKKKDIWSRFTVENPLTISDQSKIFLPLRFEGITKGGDVVFTQLEGSILVVYYCDLDTKKVHKRNLEGIASMRNMIFLDHLESIQFV